MSTGEDAALMALERKAKERRAQGDDDDEDDDSGSAAEVDLEALAKCRTMKQMIKVIQEEENFDDEEDAKPIPGTLYRVLYMGVQGQVPWGTIAVLLIQLLAPAALLLVAYGHLPPGSISKVGFYPQVWADPAKLLQSVLSATFIACFVRNAYVVTRRREGVNLKLALMISGLTRLNKRGMTKMLRPGWRHVAVFVGTWLPVITCLDMFFLFLIAGDAKDVVFDSLGLLFLFNLDNLEGDLNMIDPHVWDPEAVGKLYEAVGKKEEDSMSGTDGVFDEKKNHIREKRSHPLYLIAQGILMVFQFVLPPLFLFTAQVQSDDDVQKDAVSALLASLVSTTGTPVATNPPIL